MSKYIIKRDFKDGVLSGPENISFDGIKRISTESVFPQQRCYKGEIVFPDLTEVTNKGLKRAFYYNTRITSVSFPVLKNGEGTTETFYGCTNLTTVDMPAAINLGGWIFQSCTNLTTVNMPNLRSTNVYLFRDCKALTNIDLPSLTSCGPATFYGCTSLTTLDMSNVKTIDYTAFSGCTGLKKIWIPSTCTTIGGSAFVGAGSCTLYTDAAEQPSGWSSVPSNVVYGATHEDFENA